MRISAANQNIPDGSQVIDLKRLKPPSLNLPVPVLAGSNGAMTVPWVVPASIRHGGVWGRS